jgi:hypothetical protein
MAQGLLAAQELRIKGALQSHSIRHTILIRVPLDEWSARPLPYIRRHLQQADIRYPGGIRTHNPSNREVADPHFRPRSI